MFVCRAVCAPRDPATDTVKIDMASKETQEEADRHAAEELQAQIQAEEAEEIQRRAQEEEEAARKAEESARLALEEVARRRAEEERLRQREEARRAEKARREREAADAEEARRLEEERLTQERKEKVAAFLKEHKFKSTSAGKKTMLSTTYAIHTAAMRGDEEMVTMLIEEGADPRQKNSSGKTAAQVAQKKNSNGSHASVLRVLGGA